MRRRPACLALALIVGLMPTTPVHAEPPIESVESQPEPAPPRPPAPTAVGPAPTARLVVLPIALEGTANTTIAARIRGHLRDGLARGAFALVDAPNGCETTTCLTTLRGETGADHALRTLVVVNDRDYQVRLELLRTADGAVVITSEERCDLCGSEELGTLVATQAALLRRQLEGLIQGPPRLTITTDPAGALVFIDDKVVGYAPLERTLVEGKHTVRVTLDGYVAEERPLKLTAGVRAAVELSLRREPRAARLRAAGWAGVGLGIPGIAAGAALLALDGREIRRDCAVADGNQDVAGHCRYVHDTDIGGAIALAAGAALIGVGVALIRFHRRSPSQRARASVAPGGLGIVGRF